MRVNARLDDESREQIEYLTAVTGMGVSQVLRESVALYYRQARANVGGASRLLALAGKGSSGRSDIASDVKRHLAQGWAAKHGLSPVASGSIAPPAAPLAATRAGTRAKAARKARGA